MRNPPVHWSEGMFLRPQHFQAADRYWTEALQTSEQWDHQYNYGLRRLEISADAVKNFQFQINSCQARLKDGTLVSLETGQEPDRLDLSASVAGLSAALEPLSADLKEGLGIEPQVRVFLAVPKLKIGNANVADADQPGQHRYGEVRQSLQDESRGGNDQEIALKNLNVRLLLSTQDPSGYEVLPIAAIQRASEQEASPRLDVRYIPPLLAVDAWPPLHRGIIRGIYDMIGHRIEVLSDQVLSGGITMATQEHEDLNRLLMLSQLNEAYATLSVLAFASGIHPLVAYTELCRLVGKLSIFGKERRVPPVPRYDHDNLAGIFYWVRDKIVALLREVPDYEYEKRPFLGVGMGMQVTLDPRWLNAAWQWYVGVARGNVSESECHQLLTGEQELHWKLGSARQIDALFNNRREGLRLERMPRAPRALPAAGGWMYYELSRQPQDVWRDVHQTQTLAMRFRDRLIVNRDNLQNQRTLVLNHRGKQAALEFALFAVPIRS